MGNSLWIMRGLAATMLLSGTLTLVACSRPTPSPDQQVPPPAGQEEGYPSGGEEVVVTPGPKPGEPGYPPPNPLNPPVEDPYPGQTATAGAPSESGGDATVEATEEAGGGAAGEATATPTP